MDCSLPGSSVLGIFQARILEWVAILSFSGIFLTKGSNPCLLYLLHCREIPYNCLNYFSGTLPSSAELNQLCLVESKLVETGWNHQPFNWACVSIRLVTSARRGAEAHSLVALCRTITAPFPSTFPHTLDCLTALFSVL